MTYVSVIIPCYNSHQFLGEAIASVKKQTFTNLEIIVVNDGSTDKQTLAALSSLDASIKVLHKENGGPASARNYGIKHSVGDVIIPLDSDDLFAPDFINQAVHLLTRNPKIGVVSSYVREIGNGNKIWRTTAVDDFSFLLENRLVACAAYKKQCWTDANGYDEKMHLGNEDWDFWIAVTKAGWKVHIIPKPLFYYRKKKSSMMVDKTIPNKSIILDYMIDKHHDWFIANLKKGILEQRLINKNNLTLRRRAGLLLEKVKEQFSGI